MRRLAPLAALLLVGALVPLTLERSAAACANAVIGENSVIADVKAAERALEFQDYAEAQRLATRALPYASDLGIDDRALRIVALAQLRRPEATDEDRRAAVKTLRALEASQATNVPLQVDRAEAEASVPEGRASATRTLSELAKKDLIGSAFAYAALARLEGDAGHRAEYTQAVARCEAMATQPSICRGAKPRPAIFRGETWAYAVVGALFALGMVLVGRRRRATRPLALLGAKPVPAAASGAILTPFALGAVLLAHEPMAAIPIAIFGVTLERLVSRAVLAARARSITGTATRSYDAGSALDVDLPTVRLWPFAPATPVVIERVPEEASYREGARAAAVRLGLFPVKRMTPAYAGLVLMAEFLVVVFGGVLVVMMPLMRSSTPSYPTKRAPTERSEGSHGDIKVTPLGSSSSATPFPP